MKLTAAVFLLVFAAVAQDYPLGPDHEPKADVPKGAVTKYTFKTSKIYPGTTRDYWLYIPAQYKADTPAPLIIIQDGGGFVSETGRWRAPTVFDNLIAKKEMPATVGLFINPGVTSALNGATEQNRYNRSYEYDAVGDRYARFLIEEILPEIAKKVNISANPEHRAIGGSSSGAIAAFTAAWNRPDAFRRVISFIGSYTNLRGGNDYAGLVRKTEPKPLRVFLQDGRNDLNIYSGSWFQGNQDLSAALEYAGYESTFVIGNEKHNAIHGSSIFPNALRWTWKDYPKPIANRPVEVERHFVKMILQPGEDWQVVSQGHKYTEGPAVDKQGNVYFTDIPNNRIHRIGVDGKVSVFKEDSGGANGLMFGPDGRLYACQNAKKRIVAYTMDGKEQVVAEDVNSNDLAVTAQNEIYFSEPPTKRVWFIDAKGQKRVVIEPGTIEFPNGVRLSPDQALLLVADARNKWIWSYGRAADGSLVNGQPFYRMETPDESSASGADGMTVDTEGHLYVATSLGIQVCDQPGRVVAIINKPQPGKLSNLVFGGADMRTLYATSGDRVFKRRMNRTGTVSWNLLKPPVPSL